MRSPQWHVRIRSLGSKEYPTVFTGTYAECIRFLQDQDASIRSMIGEIQIVRVANV